MLFVQHHSTLACPTIPLTCPCTHMWYWHRHFENGSHVSKSYRHIHISQLSTFEESELFSSLFTLEVVPGARLLQLFKFTCVRWWQNKYPCGHCFRAIVHEFRKFNFKVTFYEICKEIFTFSFVTDTGSKVLATESLSQETAQFIQKY